MADRTVTVHLNAAVSRYLRNMKASEEQTARVRDELRGLREEARHLTFGGIATGLAGLPGLISPVGAALNALPGLALGAASAFGAVAISLHGMGDGFKAVNEADPEKLAEALAKLSTEGRRFVLEYQKVKPTLDHFADSMQDAFFLQLRGDLEKLVTTYLPTMLNQLSKLASEMGKMAHQEVGLLTSPHIVAKVNTQIALATELTQHWSRMLRAGTEIFFDLADAGADFNRNFVKGMADGVESLRDWVRQEVAAGRMNQVLENGAQILSELADVAAVAGELLMDFMANPALADASAAFLDTAKIMLQVVNGFLNAFSALPGPMQTVIASLFAVGGAVMLLQSRFMLLRGATLAAVQHLGTMGPAGISAANGLERTTRWAGRAVLAFTALQLAGMFVTAGAKELNPQIDAMAKNLRDFAREGHLSGEAARVLGKDIKDLDVGLKFLADTDNNRRQTARWLQESLEAIPLLGDALRKVNPTSLAHTKERVQALDAALADMVRSGHGAEALVFFERLAAQQGRYGVSVEELRAILPQYAAASQVAGGATAEMARSHELAARNAAILEKGLLGLIEHTGDFESAWEAMHGTLMDFAEAEIAAEEAVDRLSESLKENGNTLDINTEKGRENKQNLLEGVQAAVEAAQAKYDETFATKGQVAATQEANGVYQNYISKLRDAMLAAGMKKQVVDELLKSYAAMPPLVATTVSTPGLETAIARTRYLIDLARQLGSIHAAVQFSSGSGYTSGRRWGGITVHAQSGMLRDAGIYSPQSPARYAFAEPGTGGEAFVPRFGDDRRSMSILQQAAGWYGATVSRGGGGTQTVVHEHRHTVVIHGREMISGFRREVDLAGGAADDLVGRRRS